MASKKTGESGGDGVELRISRERRGDPERRRRFARRAREIQDRFIAEGREFSDSTEDIRADRDSR